MAKRKKTNGAGDPPLETERRSARTNVPETCKELQAQQRQRAWYMKSRNMVANRLHATVAGTLGYHSGMEEKDRKRLFQEAGTLIKRIVAEEVQSEVKDLVQLTATSIEGFERAMKGTEKAMVKLAKELPVAEWVLQKEQAGFGLLGLAIVVGEAGDLSNYANPGKLWRRMGCAPYSKNGETLMGATWRSRGNGKKGTKLQAEDWEAFGYSPRRRSISYLIGEGLVKQNFIHGGNGSESTCETEGGCAAEAGDLTSETDLPSAGPYRRRYDGVKARSAELHPDWAECSKCNGTGRNSKAKCANCRGTGQVWLRCHRHGMLLATKLLLKNLWIEWNNGG